MQRKNNILPESSPADTFQTSASGGLGGEVLCFPCEWRGMVQYFKFHIRQLQMSCRWNIPGGGRRRLSMSKHQKVSVQISSLSLDFHAYRIQAFVIIFWHEGLPEALSGFALKTTVSRSARKLSSIWSAPITSSTASHKSLRVQYMLGGNVCKLIQNLDKYFKGWIWAETEIKSVRLSDSVGGMLMSS